MAIILVVSFIALGVRAGNTGEIFFDNVRVPKDCMIGKEGDGMRAAQSWITAGRLYQACRGLGVATGDRAYNLGPCLRKLSEEFATRCGIGTIQQMGLLDKFTQTATQTDGGIRGVCVQYYDLPGKFERCVNTDGTWPFAGSSN